MIMNEHIKKVEQLLKATGLQDESGSVIYSGNSTLREGDYYFLGQNPGGNAEVYSGDTIISQLLQSGEFNEYHEGEWTGKKHQSNIVKMFSDFNINLANTFSTNLSFIRSVNTNKYNRNLKNDYKIFWPVHKYCLSVVKPKVIICNGADAREFFIKKMRVFPHTYEERFLERLYRGRRMKCISVRGSLVTHEKKLNIQLLSVFHLSKWPYEDYQKSVLWLKSKIKQGLKETTWTNL